MRAKSRAIESLTAIDLFSGAGGLSAGFCQAGFKIVAANDFDGPASVTFMHNHPETRFFLEPVEKVSAGDLLKVGNLKRGQLDVLLGGPPCQAFSVYNHQRGMHDDRSGLFREYLRLVEGLMPRAVVMENVTGMTSVAEGKAVDEIHSKLSHLGYSVEHRILKSEEYGVPQERRRIIFIGLRDGLSVSWPIPRYAQKRDLFSKGRKPPVTIWDAIGDLPPLGISEGQDKSKYLAPPTGEYQRMMRKNAKILYNHVAPYLAPINLKRLKHIPQGGSWRDIPTALLPSGMKKAKRSDHTKRYGRMHPDGLACTILTKCDLHWGAYIHPEQERTITVREAARLQSFPDTFQFLGSRVEQFRQVGNAVPPRLAFHLADVIQDVLIGRMKLPAAHAC